MRDPVLTIEIMFERLDLGETVVCFDRQWEVATQLAFKVFIGSREYLV